jgi:hypothetical protein
MKHLIWGAMMLVSVCASFAQTTMEEFNYITKGYAIQKSQGLDMKRGYKLEELHHETIDMYTVVISGFYKKKKKNPDNTPRALMIEISAESLKEKTPSVYYCIPHLLSEGNVWDAYWHQITQAPEGRARAICWILARSAAYFAYYLPAAEPDFSHTLEQNKNKKTVDED